MAEVAGTGSMETTGNGDSTDTTAEVLRPAFPPIKKEKLADGTEVKDTVTRCLVVMDLFLVFVGLAQEEMVVVCCLGKMV
jgi:hypothetical protein